MKRLFISCLGLFLATGAVSLAVAGGDTLPADLVARSWEQMTFDGKRANRYSACGDDCIAVDTDSSVSLIGRPVAVDLAQMPVLTWEWKVDRPVAATDLTVKGRDDRALALYVTFPYDPDTATFSESLLRPLVELARGKDAPARTLSYVWSGDATTPGTVVASPYFGDVNVMIVARSGHAPLGTWLRETVDVAADHERVFGRRPLRASHVLIGADSDDTGSRNRGFVRGISFESRPGGRG
ncbi:MAG TPA: hypothetical protein DIW51_18340 [Rhodospirillaceae bacterium]|nr:hypothetical protein [Magnetovibrio sp.]HCS71922.1 hypothetical protein [Rhodospirillaceae bacterium]|tara:strand:- start:3020 stop:3739 length:720 start_codon:yes stop_codon:yes gene_type:complete